MRLAGLVPPISPAMNGSRASTKINPTSTGVRFNGRAIACIHGGLFVLAWVTSLWIQLIILSLFNFIGNWLGCFWGLPQHCGLRENVLDFRKTVRSLRLHPVLEFLYWHMNWHTENHMYAGVPCCNLKKLHQAIKDDMPEPSSLTGAWREMLEIWERQKREPSYQFDTPLPATAQTQRNRAAVAEENSIGDLAPEGLR